MKEVDWFLIGNELKKLYLYITTLLFRVIIKKKRKLIFRKYRKSLMFYDDLANIILLI